MSRRHLIAAILLSIGGLLVGCADTSPRGTAQPPAAAGSSEASAFVVTSPAFANDAPIPVEHAAVAAGGRNVSVPLEWSAPPAGTKSFAIEVVDLHPIANSWVHWLAIDLSADTRSLPSGASRTAMPRSARELENSFGTPGWGGPQPPKGTGRHDYRITVFALDTPRLDLADHTSLDQFRRAVEPHVLASTSVVGTFER